MSAHCIDNAEGIEVPSVIAGAYSGLGAHRRGALIFFGVYAPQADNVFLVGSFNDWSESCPMVRDPYGCWRISVDKNKISDGDAYKYKMYIGNDSVYLCDPYARKTDGEPNYNSVYCDISKDRFFAVGHKGFSETDESPMIIYVARSDKWCRDKRGKAFDFDVFGRELIPYVLQMGYTHVCISGYTEGFYDHGSHSHVNSHFSPRASQGGAEAMRRLVAELHASGVGALLSLELNATFGNNEADIAFYKENALYWLKLCKADGFVISNCIYREKEFFEELVHSIKTEARNCTVVLDSDIDVRTERSVSVSAADRYLPNFKATQDAMKYLCAKASAMTLLLFDECKMLTFMGEETAQCRDIGVIFDRDVGGSYANARFQLFCSELNNTCIANYRKRDLLSESSVETVEGVWMMRRSDFDRELIAAADISGSGAEVAIDGDEWEIILDSCNALGMWGGAVMKHDHGETTLKLPPYGSAIIIKDNINSNINHLKRRCVHV